MSHTDMENLQNIEDGPFPSFLSNTSLGSSGCITVGNVTLGSILGMPMAASTVAKMRPSVDKRINDIKASYLEDERFSLMHSKASDGQQFVLSLKEDLDKVDDFIAANRISDLLVNVDLDETQSAFSKTSSGGVTPDSVSGFVPTTDLSNGRLSSSCIGDIETMAAQATVLPVMLEEKEGSASEENDSEKCSGSITSFLANEKLMSMDSMNSDMTDDDINVNQLHDEELELYFNKLLPPPMQRGRVEGQEIPVELPSSLSQPTSKSETQRNRHIFHDDCDKRDFQMPDVRLEATGMDSSPTSDEEDTKDEIEASQHHGGARFLLPSTSRQPVGESQWPCFRPGLEGGSSDEELQTGGGNIDARTGIKHPCSAEGQVVVGVKENGGLSYAIIQSTYDVLFGLGIMGGSGENRDDHQLQCLSRSGMITHDQNAMDSLYLKPCLGHNAQDTSASVSPFFQTTQSSFHLSQVPHESHKTEKEINLGQTMVLSPLGLHGGHSLILKQQQSIGSTDDQTGESLDARYLCQSFNENLEECNDIWNHQPDNMELDLQQGANGPHSVVYQNEEGKWVTDLAYYSSFEKEMEASMPEEFVVQFQSEDFLAGSQAMDKIIEDQEEFEKEHQFIQEEQIQAVNMSEVLGDTSWKIPNSNSILMKASQVSSELEAGNQSYLRISLGEFFQRRSEALGCLGSCEEDNVKRPSFGYFITSPEKRDPVALLRPSDLFSRESSIHIETVKQSDSDETLHPDDLDKTLEPNTAETAHENVKQQTTVSLEGHTSKSPNSNSNLMLSISTIASAIADASISSDPAQLAAMIMELSKHNRSKSFQRVGELIMSPVATINQNGLQEDLQKTTSAGDLSTSDMEKYLRKAEVSSIDGNGSMSHSCLDILTLADSLVNSNEETRQQLEPKNNETINKSKEFSFMEERAASKQYKGLKSKAPKQSGAVKRSAIPRSKSSSLKCGTALLSKISLNSDQSSSTSFKSKPVDLKSIKTPSTSLSILESKIGTAQPQVANSSAPGNCCSLKSGGSMSSSAFATETSPGLRYRGSSDLSLLKTSPHTHGTAEGRTDKPAVCQARSPRSPKDAQYVSEVKIGTVDHDDSVPATQEKCGSPEINASSVVEVTHCNFRPSTSPLTHSSPSQAIQSGYREVCLCSPGSGKAQRSPTGDPGSPQSHCSSPSLSRLTYLSINENTCMPTPNHLRKNTSMALSTTIVRASPTPPVEPFDYGNEQSPEYLSHSEVKGLNQKTSELDLRSQSESVYGNTHTKDNCQSGPGLYTQVDSGYSSKLSIQHPPGTATEQTHQLGSCFGIADNLTYGAVPSYSSRGVLPDFSNPLTGCSLFSSQQAQQYLSSEGLLHAPSGLYGKSCVKSAGNASLGHMPTMSGYLNPAQQNPSQYPVSKTYAQSNVGSWAVQDLADLRTQVLVPSELKFPSSCCVGIASQTSLNIFNPTERWQQVSISIASLSIDGEKGTSTWYKYQGFHDFGHKVESLPFQWLIVKNKTIIGPKCTEEQKVLFIAPKAGLYQCTLSVSSWPASAESETVAHAEVFSKKVVLFALAVNPAVDVDVGNTGCLEFGDLVEGSTKALPLKLVNRTNATVPVRLVISANASAWHCFGFSKSPVAMSMDSSFHSDSTQTSLSTSSVINHVLPASYLKNQEPFLVWVHFSAPQKYISSSGELGPADEYSARVDIEVDSPGPSHVIQSVALKGRSGTPRVHAPKDLQTVCLQATFGQTVKQTLPLKNAGNIDVLLRLKSTDEDCCFSVKPGELTLKAGEEQSIAVSFTAQGTKKHRESILKILVIPSGPQYEVMLKGEMIQRVSGKVASSPAVLSQAQVPPILSNKQFMAWGGVTLGRAVQQKLVLRNNSSTTSQKLRLLIRGQDQDCFQLQSSFGPDERLTCNRELSIKPKEDVTIHLLFAPTRIAAMLAKLEIKQSGVFASQPGVKFTIPLSGYGGASNVILEELRKHADGYVATLSGVQAGQVSKLSVCVRNTGSRAAFVKVVQYSLQNRVAMNSTISLSPSQFVLKERTQEVITIVMKASYREQALCQSSAALLATICLFCGDEVSRQQFRKLLQINPEAGNKVLSDNSLLKSITFDEMFLGEEQVHEAYDLPQRPNEAQIFYGNMSKVMLSLFGTNNTSDSAESDRTEFIRPSQRHAAESDSLGPLSRHISNVSLDVLPVKGPPLSSSEAVLKQTELNLENTWSIKPEQLVLTAPTMNSASDTRHVQILNHSNRELNFELSWPAHCLTITPHHGVIEPLSHFQILISPNPSLATKSSMLPWSGQIYVHCHNQQKYIKVQIRQDLAMDVSTTSCTMDRSLCPLPPQAETPTVPGQKPQSNSIQPRVEINNRTLIFPPTAPGESSDCSLEVENHGEQARWYLSSFAPPYVKGVDSSGDVYRATYSAFRCEKVSGILGIQEKMKVQITFLPRDCGDYAQFWDLECHPTAKPQQKSLVRFQLCGTGVRAREASSVKESCLLVKTDAIVKNRKRLESAGSKTGSSNENQKKGVYAPQSLYTFPVTCVGTTSTLKVNFRNNSSNTHELKFISPDEPFHIKHSNYSLRSQHYINLPVQFAPATVGKFSGMLIVQTDTGVTLPIELSGEALT